MTVRMDQRWESKVKERIPFTEATDMFHTCKFIFFFTCLLT